MSALTRRRLDVAEVHRLITAQRRMLDNWAESPAGSGDRRRLWKELHLAGDALADLAYGGPTLRVRLSYWLRPYWHGTDSRVWRWQRKPCRYVVLNGGSTPETIKASADSAPTSPENGAAQSAGKANYQSGASDG